MCKYILLGLVILLIALMVVSAFVVQEFGWIGFLIMLGVLVVLLFIAKKLMPRMFGYLLTRPLRRMGDVLRGARVAVHSVIPTEAPEPEAEDEEYESLEDADDSEHEYDEDVDDDDELMEVDPRDLNWYLVDFTVTPRDAGPSEGRMVNRQGWNPGLIGAVVRRADGRPASVFRGWPPLADWEDLAAVQHADVADVEIFDGAEFNPPNEMVFGEQRLRMRLGVAMHVTTVVLTYAHFTDIGTVTIPRIDVRPES